MKRFKVRKEITTVSRLRDLEVGRVIVRNVHTTSGQMIVRKGTALTEKLRRRLKEFGIRRVAVKTTSEEWVSREEKDSTECEVLDEETIQNETEDRLQRLEAIEDPDELIQRLQFGEHELRKGKEQESDGHKLQDMLRRLFQLNEDEESLREELSALPDVENSSALWNAVSRIQSPDAVESAGDVPESLIKDIIELVDERHDVKETLVDEYLEGSEALSQAIEKGLTAGCEPGGSSRNSPMLVERISALLDETESGENQDTGLNARLRTQGQSFVEEEEDRFALKQDVFTKVHEESMRTHFLDVLDGIKDPDDPIPESAQDEFQHQSELNKRLKTFRREQRQRREELAGVFNEAEFKVKSDDLTLPDESELNDALGPQLPSLENGIEPPEVAMDKLDSMLDELEDQRQPQQESEERETLELRDVLEQLVENGDLPKTIKTRIESLRNETQKLDDETEALKEQLRDENGELEKLGYLISGDLPDNPEQIDTFDIDESTIGAIRDHIEQKDQYFKRWVDLLEDTLSQEGFDEGLRSTLHQSIQQLEAKRANFDRAKLYLGDDRDVEQNKNREELLDEILETGRSSWVARYTDLSRAVVDTAYWFFSTPEDLDERKESLLESAWTVVEDTLFRRRIRPDVLDSYIDELTGLLSKTSRIIKLLDSPGKPSEYGLVHGVNVSVLVAHLTDRDRFDQQERKQAIYSALVQDTGMVVLSLREVLEGREFTTNQQDHVKRHPLFSKKLVNRTRNAPERTETVAFRHHERRDQSGYPEGLNHEGFGPIEGLLQVCDAYAAMLEDRPYRDSLSPAAALRKLASQNKKYAARFIKLLSQKVGLYPTGSFVLLSDGRLALVRQQNPDDVAGPNVIVIADENRNRLSNPEPVKLSQRTVGVRKLLKW